MQSNNDKGEAIKKHFYSTNLTRQDFERENWETYGYTSQQNFHRQNTRYGISTKSRSEYFKQTRPTAKIESFNLEEVDNFAIYSHGFPSYNR